MLRASSDLKAQAHRTTPAWVWIAIVLLSSIEPLTHLWLACFPLASAEPTGLHTGDSHVYLHCMRMLQTRFFSPYASCESPWGACYAGFYSLPAHWLYGLLGYASHLIRLSAFLALGIFNGLACAFYLYAVYRFLRQTLPGAAHLAFALFLVGGGLGGLLYLITGCLGLHQAAGFQEVFLRYAQYDLIEGAHLWPILQAPRLYYTLALGCCLTALRWFFQALEPSEERSESAPGWLMPGALAMMLMGQMVNMRVGSFAWVVAALFLITRTRASLVRRMGSMLLLTCPVVLGALITWILARRHPTYSINQFENVHESIWFSAFVSATLPHWFLAPFQMCRIFRRLTGPLRMLAFALTGILAEYILFYLGYQAYFGNIWRIADTVVAMEASRWVWIGAVLGGLAAFIPVRGERGEDGAGGDAWIALWVLTFLTGGLMAWGWYVRLVPRRLLILLGLPICMLSAQRLMDFRERHPRWARAIVAAMLVSGTCSVVVAALFFQGPFGPPPGEGPFAYRRYDRMTPADAELLEHLGPGRVLAPCYNPFTFADVIALRPENSVVFGVGTFNHSDLRFSEMRRGVDGFFEPGAKEEARAAFIAEWKPDFVYCPDTCPVAPAVIDQLRETDGLREVAAKGRGALFEVRHE